MENEGNYDYFKYEFDGGNFREQAEHLRKKMKESFRQKEDIYEYYRNYMADAIKNSMPESKWTKPEVISPVKSKINSNRFAANNTLVYKYLSMNAEDAIEIKFKTATWYNVYNLKTKKQWGFKVEDGIVTDAHADYYYSLVGKEYKESSNPDLIISKVAEQYVRKLS